MVAPQQPTPAQVRQQDWDDLKKSPEVQRRKKGMHFQIRSHGILAHGIIAHGIRPLKSILKLLMNF